MTYEESPYVEARIDEISKILKKELRLEQEPRYSWSIFPYWKGKIGEATRETCQALKLQYLEDLMNDENMKVFLMKEAYLLAKDQEQEKKQEVEEDEKKREVTRERDLKELVKEFANYYDDTQEFLGEVLADIETSYMHDILTSRIDDILTSIKVRLEKNRPDNLSYQQVAFNPIGYDLKWTINPIVFNPAEGIDLRPLIHNVNPTVPNPNIEQIREIQDQVVKSCQKEYKAYCEWKKTRA